MIKRFIIISHVMCSLLTYFPIANAETAQAESRHTGPAAIAPGSGGGDDELARLEQAMDEAMTTPEINQASWDLSAYWLRQVTALEDRIRKDLSGEHLDAFNRVAELWRQYLNEYADMVYERYNRGTIRGFASNSARIRLAEQRLRLLEGLSIEGRYKR